MIDIKALFLGPKAENQELYESLILEIIRDSCFLRKNFHPNDKPIISEKDKIDDDYQNTKAELFQQLQNVLSELKKGVPLYHPRYIGHMHGDLLISGIAAYFGTMLYNPNNVVGESSPATTKMEFEYINNLCKMVGYKPFNSLDGKEQSWGHLTSGGTSANIEAMWVARNMKYYPLAVKLASEEVEDCYFLKDLAINFFEDKSIKELSYRQLFNIPPKQILQLKDFIYRRCENENIDVSSVKSAIEKYDVIRQGIFGIHQLIRKIAKEELELPKLYIAKSQHYSWDKAMDIVGIGHNQIITVEIDREYRMDINSLEKSFDSNSPTLAIIGILGSSKQGSIDPIQDIINFRRDKEMGSNPQSFFIHIDGAYGGYFPSVLRTKNEFGSIADTNTVMDFLCKKGEGREILFEVEGKSSINQAWYDKLVAVKDSDSITIDPHKMGYIPYPAGSILFADTRVKDFVSYLPSYLNKPTDNNDLSNSFLGQWTLEGSRPGSAAAACYFSNKILPFIQDGHGILIKNSMLAANSFWKTIKLFNDTEDLNQGFRIVPLYVPESNIISYVLCAPGVITKTEYLNMLNNNLYNKFSIKGDSIIPAKNFMIAKDGFGYHDIPQYSLLEKCGIDENIKENRSDDITILSSVFMNPLSNYLDDSFYLSFWKEMVEYAHSFLSEIMLAIILHKKAGERLKILWVEDDIAIKEMKRKLVRNNRIGRFLDIKFVCNSADANRGIEEAAKSDQMEFDLYIYDLNLKNKNHITYKKDDIQPIINVIKKMKEEEKSKIIFYSYYLNDNKNRFKVSQSLEECMNTDNIEQQFVPKTKDVMIDLDNIVKKIFQFSQFS